MPSLSALDLPPTSAVGTPPTGLSLQANERQLLVAALIAHRGSVPEVAQSLGVSRGTVYNKMKKFSLDPEDYRGS